MNRKNNDKRNSKVAVAVYDLQAIMQLPKGNASVIHYTCKLNFLNLTIFDIQNNSCQSYVWNETEGNRRVKEI